VTTPFTEHFGPWSEADLLALDSGGNRIELIGGNLLVSSWPEVPHRSALALLASTAIEAAHDAGLLAWANAPVRLSPDTIVVPHVVVADTSPTGEVVDASEVVLLGEVISRGNAPLDLVLKTHLYATARIGWYLTAELEPLTVRLLRLQGERYFEHTIARDGQTLTSSFPFPFALATARLTR
jgi:hypothetical protein